MTPEAQRIALALACGVQPVIENYDVISKDGTSIVATFERQDEAERWRAELPEGSRYKDYEVKPYLRYPDYLGSLDAMRAARQFLLSTVNLQMEFSMRLYDSLVPPKLKYADSICDHRIAYLMIDASAEQQSEPLLRTIGKWEGE